MFLNPACGEVDIGQGIEFVQHYVDVVRSDSVAQAHYRFPFIGASYGVEFA